MAIEIKYIERHIRALNLAKDCAELGARLRTIKHVTGLAHRELMHLFFIDAQSAPRGRAPASPEWYHHKSNLLDRVEASLFVSIYRRIRTLGFGPDDALVSGYRHYLTICRRRPRITFDRAFDLASHTDGLWLAKTQNFSLLICPTCSSQYVAAIGVQPVSNRDCPFCKLVARYSYDHRIQSSFLLTDMPLE